MLKKPKASKGPFEEVEGKGVFIEALGRTLVEKNISINMIGIKTSEADKSIKLVRKLLKAN